MIRLLFTVNLLLLFYNSSFSQTNLQNRLSVSVFGTYVSGSTLQENIKSPDQFERGFEVELKGGYGYGVELAYDPNFYQTGIRLIAGTEYLFISDDELEYVLDNGSDKAVVRMTEEITFIPIELGLKWDLPVSGETFRVYIGGGGGVYFGDRIRQISNLTSITEDTEKGYSLFIVSGIDYYITRNLSINTEFKFRDASFDVKSNFETDVITAGDKTFFLDNPFYSRLLIDGVRLSLGFKYNF